MIKWPRCSHVVCPHAVTVIATQAFISIVFVVTETNPKRARRLSGAHMASGLMAHAA